MDDNCYNLRPVIITLDKKIIQDVPNYFASKVKYCYVYNTSYNIFRDWRPSGSSYASSGGGYKYSSATQTTCRRGGYSKVFYRDNALSPRCPSNWSYVGHSSVGGKWYMSPLYITRTSSCGNSGADVWYK